MRIFLTLHPAGNRFVPNSMTWYKNIYEPLVDLGHEVYFLRIDEAAKELGVRLRTKEFKQKFSQKLADDFIREHSKKPFDLFFAYVMDQDVEPACIDKIRKTGVPTANFSCNNIHQFYLTQNLAAHFDFNLHSEKHADEMFRSIGANPVWFQMAANPKYYHPMDINREYDVSFIGSNYARRSFYIKHLLENEINVHCFGPDWLVRKPYSNLRKMIYEYRRIITLTKAIFTLSIGKRLEYSTKINYYDAQMDLRNRYGNKLHYPISDDEMISIFNASKLNLGFLEVFENHKAEKSVKQHLHLREFEVPMCGALYMTNYSEELAEFYEPDKEVITFSNEHELLDKAGYYLKNEEEADKIRSAALKRSLSCHTYQKRFNDLFNKLSLGNTN
jgi:spore maturation protein CgeB